MKQSLYDRIVAKASKVAMAHVNHGVPYTKGTEAHAVYSNAYRETVVATTPPMRAVEIADDCQVPDGCEAGKPDPGTQTFGGTEPYATPGPNGEPHNAPIDGDGLPDGPREPTEPLDADADGGL